MIGARVLRLIDQNVIDALIELEQHPFGAGADQKIAGAGDKIVEIERRGAHLRRGIVVDHRLREDEQGGGALDRECGLSTREQIAQPAMFRLEGDGQAGLGLSDGMAQKARRRERLALGRGEDREIGAKAFFAKFR